MRYITVLVLAVFALLCAPTAHAKEITAVKGTTFSSVVKLHAQATGMEFKAAWNDLARHTNRPTYENYYTHGASKTVRRAADHVKIGEVFTIGDGRTTDIPAHTMDQPDTSSNATTQNDQPDLGNCASHDGPCTADELTRFYNQTEEVTERTGTTDEHADDVATPTEQLQTNLRTLTAYNRALQYMVATLGEANVRWQQWKEDTSRTVSQSLGGAYVYLNDLGSQRNDS